MDGTLALAFTVFGLGQLFNDHCPSSDGCFARAEAASRLTISAARSQFNGDWLGSEVMLAYDLPRSYGPLQPTVSASYSEQGEVWLGAGAKVRVQDPASPLFFETAFQIGYHDIADGPDIGGNFHFRSDLGLGYEFANGAAIIVSYDHRSNGGIKQPNPGIETLMVEYAIPLN